MKGMPYKFYGHKVHRPNDYFFVGCTPYGSDSHLSNVVWS